MSNVSYEISYLEAGLEVLESYLLADEIYWTISTPPPRGFTAFPSLTLGRMLLAETKISNLSIGPVLDMQRKSSMKKIADLKLHWRVAWEEKTRREIKAYLNVWGSYLEEYSSKPEAHVDQYSYEVTRRVILDLLFQEVKKAEESDTQLIKDLDSRVLSSFKPGDFIWEKEFLPAFPLGKFWYLFGRLR